MKETPANEILSSRLIPAPLAVVYEAFENPRHLQNWWGPHGFTNTFHEFDLKPGGNWTLTMHGPEKGNYENASIFTTVEPFSLVAWKRISKPLFEMEVGFRAVEETHTEITFRMVFESARECHKVKPFAVPKNEENFDRLEHEIQNNMPR